MDILIGVGAVISLVGLGGIVASIFQVRRAKREAADDAELKALIQKALPMNLGGFFLSVIGLMCVVVGVLLG